MSKIITFLKIINFKTIRFNLKYFPFKTALKLPVMISGNVLLLKMDGKISIDAPISTGMIKIGFGDIGIFDKKRSKSIWQVSGGTVIFKGNAIIGHGCKISIGEKGVLEFGKNISVTAETEIIAYDTIVFGNDCLISWDCLIMDTDMHEIFDKSGNQINQSKPIVIGNKVWIGCRSVILKGTKISDNSVIGTNSLISKDISDKSGVFAGNPVRFLRSDIDWKQ